VAVLGIAQLRRVVPVSAAAGQSIESRTKMEHGTERAPVPARSLGPADDRLGEG
jgi:hypothetical protein